MRNGLVLCRGRAVQRKKISWQIARVPSGMANILLSPGTTVQAPYSQACYRALPLYRSSTATRPSKLTVTWHF